MVMRDDLTPEQAEALKNAHVELAKWPDGVDVGDIEDLVGHLAFDDVPSTDKDKATYNALVSHREGNSNRFRLGACVGRVFVWFLYADDAENTAADDVRSMDDVFAELTKDLSRGPNIREMHGETQAALMHAIQRVAAEATTPEALLLLVDAYFRIPAPDEDGLDDSVV